MIMDTPTVPRTCLKTRITIEAVARLTDRQTV